MRQVKKSTFRVLCFVPLVLAAYATVAGTLWKNSSLEETLLLSSHIKPVTNFGKLAVKRKWQVSTIHIVGLAQRIHRSRSNSFAEIPIDVNRSNIPSIKNICGTDHYINLECLEIPFRKQHRPHPMSSPCHKPHFKNIATNPAIDRIKRFRSSLCGYPVSNTKCPWTPGVTKVERWQQRSLERNHMKRTNPQTTHVDSSIFLSYHIWSHSFCLCL